MNCTTNLDWTHFGCLGKTGNSAYQVTLYQFYSIAVLYCISVTKYIDWLIEYEVDVVDTNCHLSLICLQMKTFLANVLSSELEPSLSPPPYSHSPAGQSVNTSLPEETLLNQSVYSVLDHSNKRNTLSLYLSFAQDAVLKRICNLNSI